LKFVFYLLLIVIMVLIYYLLKQLKKNVLIIALCSLIIIYFIVYPKYCINSTLSGAKIFFTSVFPSLFPFLVISNILLSYDGVRIYSKIFGRYLCPPLKLPLNSSFVLVVSALCGYPLGAKYACDLYDKKLISTKQCARLINIASNAGPLFIVGAVGTTMLDSPRIGYLLLISNYISCLMMGILLPSSGPAPHDLSFYRNPQSEYAVNFGGVLRDSIDNGIKTCLSIGGYITMFSVIIDIIKNNVIFNIVIDKISIGFIPKEVIGGLLLGIVEITKGSFIVASSGSSLLTKVFIIGFFLGFSGISIISQVYSFTFKYPELSISKYIKRKLLQGVICGLLSVLSLVLFTKTLSTQPAMSYNTLVSPNNAFWLLLLLLLPIFVHNIRRLFHIS
jgi:sporulation integral membrane protein YlbJ